MRLDYAIKFVSDMDLANGIIFTSPPASIHGTRIARFRDPGRAEISISRS